MEEATKTVVVSPLKFDDVLQYSLGFVRSMVRTHSLNRTPENWTKSAERPTQLFHLRHKQRNARFPA
jgi:hypothetical protein